MMVLVDDDGGGDEGSGDGDCGGVLSVLCQDLCAASLPTMYKDHLNELRKSFRLRPLEYGTFGIRVVGEDNDILELDGDFAAWGVCILELPGDIVDGPLTLSSRWHRILHHLNGSRTSVAFSIVAAAAFDDKLTYTESAQASTKKLRGAFGLTVVYHGFCHF